MKLTNLTN